MPEVKLLTSQIRGGGWHGRIEYDADGPPEIEILHEQRALSDLRVTRADEGTNVWLVDMPLPATLINEGIQTFIVRDKVTHETICHFSILAGEILTGNLSAEVELLKAEVEMLKRVIRRHLSSH